MAWLVPNRPRGPRVAAAAGAATYYQYVDTPGFSYAQWMDACDGPIATFDAAPTGTVAIVGAGLGGLAAAYELLRCGVPIKLFEATDRIGGRLYSKEFVAGQPELAELGAMRFPPSEELLFRYIDQFEIATEDDFPDPGAVETLVSYQGQSYRFTNQDQSQVPQAFKDLSAAWTAFLESGATVVLTPPDGVQTTIDLAAPDAIASALTTSGATESAGASLDVKTEWQKYIDVFANKSLYDGLMLIFSGPNPPGGKAWSVPDDYERFAALGTGFGGFGPLYQVCFLDILRLMVNGLETDQRFIPGGVGQIAESLYSGQISQPGGGTTTVADHTVLNTPVDGVYRIADGLLLVGADGAPLGGGPFAHAIVATTQRAMEIDAKLGLFNSFQLDGQTAVGPTLATQSAAGVRDLHIMNSTKVFVRTATQFWKDLPDKTRCILSDSLSTNLYTLAYSDAPGASGVVLVSYVWGDQSIKQITFQDKQARLALLREALAPVDAAFAAALVPADGDYDNNVQMIDWELAPHFYGAFKLNRPGQDHYVQQLFFDYLKVSGPTSTAQVFVAGDSVSWIGGWTEGALQTAMNAACAAATALGGTVQGGAATPMGLDPTAYSYDVATA